MKKIAETTKMDVRESTKKWKTRGINITASTENKKTKQKNKIIIIMSHKTEQNKERGTRRKTKIPASVGTVYKTPGHNHTLINT